MLLQHLVHRSITVSYDTHYNVSVEATLCGQRNVSSITEIYYSEYLNITLHGHFNNGQKCVIQVCATIHSKNESEIPVLWKQLASLPLH